MSKTKGTTEVERQEVRERRKMPHMSWCNKTVW